MCDVPAFEALDHPYADERPIEQDAVPPVAGQIWRQQRVWAKVDISVRDPLSMPGRNGLAKMFDWLGATHAEDGSLWMAGGPVTVLLDGVEIGQPGRIEGLARDVSPAVGRSLSMPTPGTIPAPIRTAPAPPMR